MSEPLGATAIMALGVTPWKSVRETLVTVSSTATPIPTSPLANRKGVWVHNIGTTNCFLGFTSAVGTSNEVILYAAQDKILPLTDQVTLYGRVASGSATVRVWEYL